MILATCIKFLKNIGKNIANLSLRLSAELQKKEVPIKKSVFKIIMRQRGLSKDITEDNKNASNDVRNFGYGVGGS